MAVNVGVHEPATGNKLLNTLLWITKDGEISHKYQKLHLFDVNLERGPVIQESNSTESGVQITAPFETTLGRIGLAICFDLRFPELALSLRRQGSDIITYPSAFAIPTGKAHWHTLLRARAIETQSYVIAAAQVGDHNGRRASYGHSLIVGPWGDIKTELGGENNGPELATAQIDHAELARVRSEMPLQRRMYVSLDTLSQT